MKKKEFISLVSKIDTTFEDEFKSEYNSPELLWDKVLEPIFKKSEIQEAASELDSIRKQQGDLSDICYTC